MAMKEGMKFPTHYPLTRLVVYLPQIQTTYNETSVQGGGEESEEDPEEDQEQVVGAGQQEEEERVRRLHGGPGQACQRRKCRT